MDSFKEQQSLDPEFFDCVFWSSRAISKFAPTPKKDQLQDEKEQVPLTAQDEEFTIPRYKEDIHFFFCASGYMIGYGNFISFPNKVFSQGGIAFLIIYTVAILTLALPMQIVETAWGQLITCRLNHRFSMIHPRLWSLSAGIALLGFLDCTYYSLFFPWFFHYLVSSFSSPFPWATKTEEGIESWNPDYFKEDVLQVSDGIGSPIRIVPLLLVLLMVSYFFIYLTVRNGLETASQVVYYTVPIPAFLVTLLIIKGFSLEGSVSGLQALLKPDWSKLFDLKVWESAFLQAIFSVATGNMTFIHFGASRQPSSKILKTSFYLTMLDFGSSLLAAISIYSFMGFVAHDTGKPIEEYSKGGIELVYIAYPGLLSTFQASNMWAIIFFVMMLLLGIDSIFSMVDVVITYSWDSWPWVRDRVPRPIFTILGVFTLFMATLPYTTTNGWWYFLFAIDHLGGWVMLLFLTLETVVIMFVFGFEKLEAMIFNKTGERVPKFFKPLIQFVTLPILLILTLYSAKLDLNQKHNSAAEFIVGMLLRLAPVVLFVGGLFFTSSGPTAEQLIVKFFGMSSENLVKQLRQAQGEASSNSSPSAESAEDQPQELQCR